MSAIHIPFLIDENGKADTVELTRRLRKDKQKGRMYLEKIDIDSIVFVTVGEDVTRKWIKLLRDELDINFKLVIVYLKAYSNGYKVFPKMEDIFNVFKMPVKNIRVVLVGQDPYPSEDKGEPVAIGYSFATRSKKCPHSLKNMLNLVGGSHFVKNDFTLKGWIDQGVFLFNMCLFFYYGDDVKYLIKGHEMWSSFNARIFEYIRANNPTVKYLLMGAEAQKLVKFGIVQERDCVIAPHPSSRNASSNFRDCDCFNRVNTLLREEIVWSAV